MTLVLAHAGHWVTSVITMAPLFALMLWLLLVTIRDRRQGGTDDGPEETPLGDPSELGVAVPVANQRQGVERASALEPPRGGP